MDQRSLEEAVRSSWLVRDSQAAKKVLSGRADTGLRGAVTGGGHLDAITELLADVFRDAGLPAESVRCKSGVELPGYFRPAKKWDLVVIHEGELVAAIELESHVGPSFSNNFNNRNEEAIGSAVDLRQAYDHGLLGAVRPWLGYLLLVEEAPGSVRRGEPRGGTFPVDPVFAGTSHLDRYVLLCKRLRGAGLYDATCLLASSREGDAVVRQPDPEVGFAAFGAAILARIEETGLLPRRN
ncbi:PaeR7I family type II restriction endonuclease [Micromonospora matsumotoense]|uniref:PaeR7I family type II restriction endonuclease n=1 Tax=Micromonospora matsumotoense TaxID=121616 RepID=UPI003419280D